LLRHAAAWLLRHGFAPIRALPEVLPPTYARAFQRASIVFAACADAMPPPLMFFGAAFTAAMP